MRSYVELYELLRKILGSDEVYFQPPPTVRMAYPAIVFSESGDHPAYANNKIYANCKQYEVALIDKNPDSQFVADIRDIPYCRYSRQFKADNLNHFVFEIYF